MKIKHFQGYGNVNAIKVMDKSCTLHIKVSGNHEWGLVREDSYDLFHWLVQKFDSSIPDFKTFRLLNPSITVRPGYEHGEETCDYLFSY